MLRGRRASWCRSGWRRCAQGVELLRFLLVDDADFARRRGGRGQATRRGRPGRARRRGPRARGVGRVGARADRGRAAGRAGRRSRPQAAQCVRPGAGRRHRQRRSRRRCSSRWNCSAGNARWPGCTALLTCSHEHPGHPGRPRRGPGFLTTGAVYTEDLVDDRLAGALHVTFVRSPIAHATIASIDTSAAEAAPGVVAVLTAADLAELPAADPPFPMFPAADGPAAARR